MIHKLLCGPGERAQKRLQELLSSIGESPRLLWYPSAGDDYRDIMDFSPERASLHKMDVTPDLHIHTDGMPCWLKTMSVIHKEFRQPVEGDRNKHQKQLIQQGIVYMDERTKVRIEEVNELAFIRPEEINYAINPEYVDFPEEALSIPKVYLLDVVLESASLGQFRKPVLYFFFENINFLEEILLKHRWPITHLLKVREGCGFGGNRKSIALSYAFLSELQTRYLVTDSGGQMDAVLADRIAKRVGFTPAAVELEPISQISIWSKYSEMSVFKVHPQERRWRKRDLDRLMHQVWQEVL